MIELFGSSPFYMDFPNYMTLEYQTILELSDIKQRYPKAFSLYPPDRTALEIQKNLRKEFKDRLM